MYYLYYYEYAKRTKFLLTVICGSPRRHSNSCKTFEKNRKKLKYIFMTILGLAESFKMMNRPGPTVTLFDGLFIGKYKKIEMWNFDTIFIWVFNLYYYNLESIPLIVWKLCVFRKRSHFGNFQQFFHLNFRLKWKFWILMDSLESSNLDLSEYTIFDVKIIFVHKLK